MTIWHFRNGVSAFYDGESKCQNEFVIDPENYNEDDLFRTRKAPVRPVRNRDRMLMDTRFKLGKLRETLQRNEIRSAAGRIGTGSRM